MNEVMLTPIGCDAGVDWEAVCAGGEDMVTVPHMQMGCDNCGFIPENRQDKVNPYDAEFIHFECAPSPLCSVVPPSRCTPPGPVAVQQY